MTIVCLGVSAQTPDPDPFPKSVEDFRKAVQAVLTETGVPGAGIALVQDVGCRMGRWRRARRSRSEDAGDGRHAFPRRIDQ